MQLSLFELALAYHGCSLSRIAVAEVAASRACEPGFAAVLLILGNLSVKSLLLTLESLSYLGKLHTLKLAD